MAHRLAHFDFNFTFSGDKENVNFPSGKKYKIFARFLNPKNSLLKQLNN